MNFLTRIGMAGVLLMVVACGGDAVGPDSAELSATLDGVAFVGGDVITGATLNAGVLNITSQEISLTPHLMTMHLSGITGTGTYALGGNTSNIATVTDPAATPGANNNVWAVSNTGGGSGTFVITELSSTHLVATFSFTAVPSSANAVGNRVVTNGRININISQ